MPTHDVDTHPESVSLPLDLTTEAAQQFPQAVQLARSLAADQASLEPIKQYLRDKHRLSAEHTEVQVRAYLKYMVLAAVTHEKLAPSEEADGAWHAHLLHTLLYEPWCRRHFGRLVHHVPTGPDVHPPQDFLQRQHQLGAFFFGHNSIYTSRTGDCGNSHDCTHGCSPVE